MPTIKQYLKLPDNFLGDVQENWSLGPCINSSMADERARADGKMLVRRMKKLRHKIIRCHHWGCGWVEHVSFPVVENGVSTKELEVVEKWVEDCNADN